MNITESLNYIQQHSWMLWLILLWVVPWKGYGLWKAAQNKDQIWFVAILVLNTLGILPIIYIFFINKNKKVKNK
ncbi:MAG TPA: hypothetical protein ENL06_01300 [Candidatus Portnoybacteria bacterium]|nr:hypothetical protein [Candidatus Portnoybacteria bacterium]